MWEYEIVSTQGNKVDAKIKLNELGKEGWELVAVWNYYTFYLKRFVETKKQQAGFTAPSN